MTMKPVEIFDAERAYKEGKQIFMLDRSNNELIHINRISNKNAVLNMFSQPYYLFYVYEKGEK